MSCDCGRFPLEKETYGGHRQEDYADTYGNIEETETKKFIKQVTEFLQPLSLAEDKVEEDQMRTGEMRETVLGMSRTETLVCKLPSLRRAFISVDERCSQTYLTDAFGSENVCYVGQAVDEDRPELLGAPTERFVPCKKIDYGRVVASSNARFRCLKVFIMFTVFKY